MELPVVHVVHDQITGVRRRTTSGAKNGMPFMQSITTSNRRRWSSSHSGTSR